MEIDWASLGSVFVVALAAVAVVTGLFAVGVRGVAARADARENGGTGTAGAVTAGTCFVVCAAVVGYGIYLIVAA
ncbi:hypothetical protein GCM10027445_10770 [Amycolatopsis endophytica]|uniref:Uncharacterized protein n=1 Tax=Amycolatopsis endophytica TaxID=860233 RepID=A0A853AXJ9_9PSEU|nr:hypothetical protein [Amycolatopsis endophytica]NYI87311.1 hypothetical protein [Amycolatopsis endophytica]